MAHNAAPPRTTTRMPYGDAATTGGLPASGSCAA